MTNPKTEKVRRYQAARTRLPSIRLTTADRANLDICIMRHGATAEAVKSAVARLIESYATGRYAEASQEQSEGTGERLQSVFLPAHYAEAWRVVSHDCGGPKALRRALHEYAMRITKALK